MASPILHFNDDLLVGESTPAAVGILEGLTVGAGIRVCLAVLFRNNQKLALRYRKDFIITNGNRRQYRKAINIAGFVIPSIFCASCGLFPPDQIILLKFKMLQKDTEDEYEKTYILKTEIFQKFMIIKLTL